MPTKKEKDQLKQGAREILLKSLKPGDTLFFMTLSVSHSGMSRHIACLLPYEYNGKLHITNRSYTIGRAIDYRVNKDRDAIVSTGCGYSHAQQITESLSYALFGNGNSLEYKDIN